MEEINPKLIEGINLGKSCPNCQPGDPFSWLYAISASEGAKFILPHQDDVLKVEIEKNPSLQAKVLLYHNKCKYYKLIDKDWISLVKEKINEGFVLQSGVSRRILIRVEDMPPASLQAYKKENKSGCFIATAVYGSPLAQDIVILQFFRDEILERSTLGRAFITGYYRFSPFFARLISQSETLKKVVRTTIIRPLVRVVESLLEGKRIERNVS